MSQAASAEKPPIVIKKYANRRLYDTQTSAYITLEDLYQRVKRGEDFTVVDAKTGEDLTRQTLAQIIFEQETKGLHLLPTNFLHSVIRFDDGMQEMLQHYLEASMKVFTSNQERMRGLMSGAMGKAMEGFSPFAQLEEVTRQNMALFEKTMQMFKPFGGIFGGAAKEEKEKKGKE